MIKVKVKSPYGSSKQRGVEVSLYEDKCDAATRRWSGVLYDDAHVKKLRSIPIDYKAHPHVSSWARESNFLVQHNGAWHKAQFNGEYLSWIEN